jgi:hypothetical protein
MNATPTIAVTSAIGAIAAATMLLAGCSPTATPAASPSGTATPVFEHIHELVPDASDGTLLVATHEGLYRLTIDAAGTATAAGPIGGLDFDPMGFTIAGGIAYASGHPGPTTPSTFGSPNLGLITSTDIGESWTNVSLTGQTDFHGLTVNDNGGSPRVFGYDASAGRVERSLDGGMSWIAGAALSARDILAVGDQLYATTPDGLAISEDDGATFTVDPDAPSLFVIASDDSGTLAGVDTTGTLWTRSAGQDWVHGHTVDGTPQAFAVSVGRLYVADDRGIAYTEDAGATWVVLQVRT